MSTDEHVATFNLVLMIIRSEDLLGPKLHFHATEKNRCQIIKLAGNYTPTPKLRELSIFIGHRSFDVLP
jgi:hypothetical protein